MFENIINFFKGIGKKNENKQSKESSKDAAKERLHLVLMQDRANVSADFLELMKQEIIDVIKKYIDVDEKEIDVRLTNKENEDGTNGAPALYANIPILNIKNDVRKIETNKLEQKEEKKKEEVGEENKDNISEEEKSKKNEDVKSDEKNKDKVEKSKEEEQKEIEAQEKIQEIMEEVIEESVEEKEEKEKVKSEK